MGSYKSFLQFPKWSYSFSFILAVITFNCSSKVNRISRIILTEAATEDVLKNFVKFTGKHLCQGLFFNKVARLWTKFLRTPPEDCFWAHICNAEYLLFRLRHLLLFLLQNIAFPNANFLISFLFIFWRESRYKYGVAYYRNFFGMHNIKKANSLMWRKTNSCFISM